MGYVCLCPSPSALCCSADGRAWWPITGWQGGDPAPQQLLLPGDSPDLWHTPASPSCASRTASSWQECLSSVSGLSPAMPHTLLEFSCSLVPAFWSKSLAAVAIAESATSPWPGWPLCLGFHVPSWGAAAACATVTAAACATVTPAACSEFVSCKQDVSQCCPGVFHSDRQNCPFCVDVINL